MQVQDQTIVNLTPHGVHIVTDEGTVTLPPSFAPARCERVEEHVRSVELGSIRIPIRTVHFTTVNHLPARQQGVLLVVSRLVAEAMPDRGDLVVPDGTIRDEIGRVVGCTGLATLADHRRG